MKDFYLFVNEAINTHCRIVEKDIRDFLEENERKRRWLDEEKEKIVNDFYGRYETITGYISACNES